MVKSLLKKASLVCLLAMLFVPKSNATDAEWYCDPNNGTYSVMDLSYFHVSRLTNGLTMDLLLAHNPYRLYVPQNIAAGEQMVAHFKTHCVGFNAVRAFTITATARDAQRQAVASQSISCKTKKWTSDYSFGIPESTEMIDFTYLQNGNTKAKETMFWIPMPLHLDVSDQNFCEPVELEDAVELRIPINTFFLAEGVRDITIAKTGNGANCEDFEIVRGTVHPANRCGTFRWVDHSQRRFFADTRLEYLNFVIRFTPSAAGERECEFVVSAGSQSKVIRVKAKGKKREVTFVTVGEGAVKLYVNHSEDPITTSPYEFKKGDHLRFVAIPDPCNHFVNWSINPLHHFPVIDVIGQHSFVVHANFAPTFHSVVVVESDTTMGYVCYDRCPAHHICGSQMLFTAHPKPGYKFKGWSTCCNPDSIISTEEQYLVELTEAVCLKANFEEEGEDDGFRIICEKENGGIDVRYSNPMSTLDVALLYSYDRQNWYDYTIGDLLHLANKGDSVYLKAKTTNSKICSRSYSYNTMPDPAALVPAIYVSDSASVAGNIMYLLDNTGRSTTMESDAFAGLFSTDKIVNANELILPADTVSPRAYGSMFLYCTTLQNAPELPATVVGYSGYLTMFAYCSSLESVPSILPADSVDFKAYESMFEACTVLNTVPEISATKIGEDGCRMMFRSCTSLETAPEINATQLQPACYQYMYEGCTSLVDAPALPATTLQPRCYSFMFANCTSLETAPVLPAQTLVNECYRNMFDGCSSLNRIEVAFTGDWDKWKTYNWTRGVAEEGTFVCPATLTETRNYGTNMHYIPADWNIVRPTQQNAPRRAEKAVEYIAMGEGMNIIVSGATDAMVYVYDAAGRMVSSIANASDFETISIAVPGVYVVVVPGQEPTRVVVK